MLHNGIIRIFNYVFNLPKTMKQIAILIFVSIMVLSCSESKNNTTEQIDSSIYYNKGGITVRKVKVDSIEYIIVKNFQHGISIIRHSK